MPRLVTFLAFAFAFAASTALVAAPAPPPTEKELIAKNWGKTEGDGEFELKGKQLTVRDNFGKPNHAFSWAKNVSAPRTGKVISGDFEITVCVSEAVAPKVDSKHEGVSSETNAGIYIQGGNSSLRYCLHQGYQRFPGAQQNDKLQRWLKIEANYPRGGATGSIKQAEDGKSTHLRLVRKGKELTMSYSFDGETWSKPTNPFRNIDMDIPDEVTVGVFLSHSTYQAPHAIFEGFTITKPKDEKKANEKKADEKEAKPNK